MSSKLEFKINAYAKGLETLYPGAEKDFQVARSSFRSGNITEHALLAKYKEIFIAKERHNFVGKKDKAVEESRELCDRVVQVYLQEIFKEQRQLDFAIQAQAEAHREFDQQTGTVQAKDKFAEQHREIQKYVQRAVFNQKTAETQEKFALETFGRVESLVQAVVAAVGGFFIQAGKILGKGVILGFATVFCLTDKLSDSYTSTGIQREGTGMILAMKRAAHCFESFVRAPRSNDNESGWVLLHDLLVNGSVHKLGTLSQAVTDKANGIRYRRMEVDSLSDAADITSDN